MKDPLWPKAYAVFREQVKYAIQRGPQLLRCLDQVSHPGRAGGRILTPPLAGTILPGITRDSLLVLAKELGCEVTERRISWDEWREGAAEGRITEVFGCGTAAVVTPIGRVVTATDEFTIGSGGPEHGVAEEPDRHPLDAGEVVACDVRRDLAPLDGLVQIRERLGTQERRCKKLVLGRDLDVSARQVEHRAGVDDESGQRAPPDGCRRMAQQ